jgi:hypothetical protein
MVFHEFNSITLGNKNAFNIRLNTLIDIEIHIKKHCVQEEMDVYGILVDILPICYHF